MKDLLQTGCEMGAVTLTKQARKLVVGGESAEYPVYRIKLSELRYNPQNDRIATWVSEYDENHEVRLSDTDDVKEFNDVVEGFIFNSDPDKLRLTEKSIKENGQQEPGVILANGLVLDGNRRFTCLRRLSRNDERFNWFEAIILDNAIGNDRETVKCLELMLQFGREERVSYDPVDRLVGIYRDLIDDDTRIETLTPEKYAHSAGIAQSKLNGLMEKARLMSEFLDAANASKRFSLARGLKIDGPLTEIQSMFKKCSSPEEVQRIKAIAFANMLVEPDQISPFMRKIKKVINAGDCDEFLNREDELALEVYERLEEEEEVTADVIKDKLRADLDLKDRMKCEVERAQFSMQQKKLLKSPASALRDAVAILSTIDLVILAKLKKGQLLEMREGIDNIRGVIDGLELAVDEAARRTAD